MPEFRHWLRGRLEHRLDASGRVSLPLDWRPQSGAGLLLLCSQRDGRPCISAMPQEEFDERLRQIDEAQHLDPADRRSLKAKLHMLCRLVSVDKSGRLSVPRDCRDWAALQTGAAVALLGRGGHFEIWNPDNWAVAEREERERLQKLSDDLGIL